MLFFLMPGPENAEYHLGEFQAATVSISGSEIEHAPLDVGYIEQRLRAPVYTKRYGDFLAI